MPSAAQCSALQLPPIRVAIAPPGLATASRQPGDPSRRQSARRKSPPVRNRKWLAMILACVIRTSSWLAREERPGLDTLDERMLRDIGMSRYQVTIGPSLAPGHFRYTSW